MALPVNTTRLAIAAVVFSVASGNAYADRSAALKDAYVSYNNAGLHYIEQDLDDYNCNQDGLRAYASVDIDGHWYALGSVTDVSGNHGCGSSTLAAGAGYRTAFSPSFDLYGTLSVEHTSPDNGSNDTGLIAAAGLRGIIYNNIEGKAEIAHHTAFRDTTALNLGANYWFTRTIAATLDTSLSDEGNSIAAGARINF
ncbi:porin family protein [Gilvimarinus polysaccharolyticus]|uniref:hypothetical protein n=1 Tax=Gilvimarinus polysaccharolyticus TaxID=863921 RepID=UPI000673714F|nr:hypothetical protein [Gilvimarinus polysaccharolyticus]